MKMIIVALICGALFGFVDEVFDLTLGHDDLTSTFCIAFLASLWGWTARGWRGAAKS